MVGWRACDRQRSCPFKAGRSIPAFS